MTKGCEFQKKTFKVITASGTKENLCWNCTNNKYRGGNIEICDGCVGYNNFKLEAKNA